MSTEDRLIYMANQIARNLASEGAEKSVAMTHDHLRDFWDPAMRRRIIAIASLRPDDLSPIAAAAIRRMQVP